MPTRRINELLLSLPFDRKLIGAGSVLMILSLFMPWYQDRDTFNTGDMFFGLTGPLYLAGFSILVLAALNITFIVFDVLNKKMPFITMKASSFFLLAGLVSFYVLLLVNSVYFHAKFGLNITIKQSDFGMFFAFIAASLITIGGYLAGRDKVSLLKDFQKEAQEQPVKMPSQSAHATIAKLPSQEIRKPKENLRTIPSSPAAQQNSGVQTQIQAEEAAKTPPQPYRMDL